MRQWDLTFSAARLSSRRPGRPRLAGIGRGGSSRRLWSQAWNGLRSSRAERRGRAAMDPPGGSSGARSRSRPRPAAGRPSAPPARCLPFCPGSRNTAGGPSCRRRDLPPRPGSTSNPAGNARNTLPAAASRKIGRPEPREPCESGESRARSLTRGGAMDTILFRSKYFLEIFL